VVVIIERVIASYQMDEAQFDSCGGSTEENINFDVQEYLKPFVSFVLDIIQTKTRHFSAQTYFWKATLAILAIQCQARKIKAVNTVQRLREKKASTKIRTW